MTALIALRCQDGVVIAADSCIVLGDGSEAIEQRTDSKIDIVWSGGEKLIVGGAGHMGHHQRFIDSVRRAAVAGPFRGKCEMDVARELGRVGREEFAGTGPLGLLHMNYTALVAFEADGAACLCELPGMLGLQPEIKPVDGQWFASAGSARVVTDTLLAFFRSVLWQGAPNVRAGGATAWWVLDRACATCAGVRAPIRVAVFTMRDGDLDAWLDDDLIETADIARDAAATFASCRNKLLGAA